jgi:hypothetical protein
MAKKQGKVTKTKMNEERSVKGADLKAYKTIVPPGSCKMAAPKKKGGRYE